MLLIYNTGILFYGLAVRFLALFSTKARLFVEGRKNIFSRIGAVIPPGRIKVWFHFASLGEFEQGRPVLEAFKLSFPDKYIVITFFSPSGFEVRKNYTGADAVFYLPLDTRLNAQRFIRLIQPEMAVFTKYEFWYHYFSELRKQNISLYLISTIFRKDQIFFKWYGSFYRNILFMVTRFFVQNQESAQLLGSIGINDPIISGDTRFDRVYANAKNTTDLPFISSFCNGSKVFICGSTWPEDEQLIAELAKEHPGWKFIIVPHEVDDQHIRSISKKFSNNILHSQLALNKESVSIQTLIIDNVGMLSSLYQYGQLAYIGGGFGKGIHNTLEAAAFGLPVIFGPEYHKFQEAKDLLARGAAISITNQQDLNIAFNELKQNAKASSAALNYVNEQKGATEIILDAIKLTYNNQP
ncbi:MAG: 3-deoxy-D-manno-octulosonic acid transferase [Pedobacter sp.]|nr:MAG: 3-deoxy-D-manno-octulosonic acid transferase [Pedobacter sp.]